MPTFKFIGEVIHGSGDGRKLGFPTANIDVNPEDMYLDFGVYACFVRIPGKKLQGILHWGPRKVFDEVVPRFEIHILNFAEDIYNKSLEIEILNKIRETKKFKNTKELISQINNDIKIAKDIFKTHD